LYKYHNSIIKSATTKIQKEKLEQTQPEKKNEIDMEKKIKGKKI